MPSEESEVGDGQMGFTRRHGVVAVIAVAVVVLAYLFLFNRQVWAAFIVLLAGIALGSWTLKSTHVISG